VDPQEGEPLAVNAPPIPTTGSGPPAERLDARLREVRRLIRSSLAVRALSLAVAAAVGLGLLSFAADRTFRLPVAARAAVLAGAVAVLAWLLVRLLVRPWRARLTPAALAEIIERRHPELGDCLRSAVEFRLEPAVAGSAAVPEDATSPAAGSDPAILMKRRVVREAAARAAAVDGGRVVDLSRVTGALLVGAALAAGGGVLGALSGDSFATWVQRNVLLASVEWPYRTRLVVEGFPASDPALGVPRGDRLTIRVRAEGEVPSRVRIRFAYTSGSTRSLLAREGEAFIHEHGEVTEPFAFTVEGGDFRSDEHRVRVQERPDVAALRLTLRYPEYTGKAAEVLEHDLGEVAVPAGTAIDLEGQATKELAAARLESEGRSTALALDPADRRRFAGTFVPAAAGTAAIHLEDAEGVPPDRTFRFAVIPVPDRPPSVAVEARGVGPLITPSARIPLKARATDDYAVAALGVDFEVKGTAARQGKATLPPLAGPGPAVEMEHALEVAPLEVKPEERLDLRITATDNDALQGPKTAASAALSFLVVTPERLLEEFLRREEEMRRLFERALAEEKGVRDAVYRLIDEAWKQEGPLPDATVKEMASLARTERDLARQAGSIAGGIRMMLEEMRNNRVAELSETERLGKAILEPLAALAEDLLPAAGRRIAQVRELADAAGRVREGLELAAAIDDLVARMEAVLANMRRLEGFTEIVNRLRAIIKLQDEAAEASRKQYRRELDRLFEEVEPAPGTSPR
jgi:hypothetical protein